MNKIYAGRIFADHYQFYLFDASESLEDMPNWDEESANKGYISNGRAICLGTKADLNEHWLDIYLSDRIPELNDCERALSLNLKIASGEFGIATPIDRIARISVEEGFYIAYVLAFNLGIDPYLLDDMEADYLSDEELEQRTDFERYTIVLVPGSTQSEGVVKGEQYLH